MKPMLTPTPGVNPRDALATSVFASPGVYAFLVGSGLSTAAGIPTGERIVQDLIRKLARNRGVDLDLVDRNPQAWWEAETGSPGRYDDILRDLAPTDGARQALLRPYFELQADGGTIQPTAAHQALARLCARQLVQVIVTTNFDDLIERALDAEGVTPQVLTNEAAIKSRIPLVHAGCTIVKLHGDYRRLGLRNTPMELARYGRAQRALLRQIFEEYGLVVIGWSAEWDVALTEAVAKIQTRRYPTYWAVYREELTRTARQLITSREAHEVRTEGAEEFLSDLLQRINRLSDIAARRSLPTVHGLHSFAPNGSTPSGWAAVPLLIVRTAALVQPVPTGLVGLIGPEVREQIVRALDSPSLRRQLADLSMMTPAFAAPRSKGPEAEPPPSLLVAEPLTEWLPPPNARQSVDQARYRLGGDASWGVSALAAIHLPLIPGYDSGGGALFTLDLGISVESKLDPATIASVMREGLILVARQLPESVATLLPADSSVVRCDCHLLAAQEDGEGGWRENNLEERIDTTLFRNPPSPSPTLDRSLGFAAPLLGPVTDLEAAQIVAEGFNYMALAAGYLDPRAAHDQICVALGLAPAS